MTEPGSEKPFPKKGGNRAEAGKRIGATLALAALGVAAAAWGARCAQGLRVAQSSAVGNELPGSGDNAVPKITDPLGVLTASRGYLYEMGDLAALGNLLLPYVQPPEADAFANDANVATGLEAYREFLQQALSEGMQLRPLAPGRALKLRILKDASFNATMDSYQKMRVYTGYLTQGTPSGLIATMCHEIAHSARNHGMLKRKPGSAVEAIQTKIEKYLVQQYDVATSRYTHDKVAYLALRKEWDAGPAQTLGTLNKRTESEADIIGGMICGAFGMSAELYRQGFIDERDSLGRGIALLPGTAAAGTGTALSLGLPARSTFRMDGGSASDPKSIETGSTFVLDYSSTYSFLFPVDSHPSYLERIDQLDRLKAGIDARFDPQSTIYKKFAARLKDGPVTGNVNLAPETRSDMRTVTASDGTVLSIPVVRCAEAPPLP